MTGSTGPAQSLEDVFLLDVDYGASEAEYAARFLKSLASVDRQAFPDGGVNPRDFPSGGTRGRYVRRIVLFRPRSVPSAAILRQERVASGMRGDFLHPFELLALCAEYVELGQDCPLLSSPDHVAIDKDGNARQLIVSGRGRGRGRAVCTSAPSIIGWSAACRFPVYLL